MSYQKLLKDLYLTSSIYQNKDLINIQKINEEEENIEIQKFETFYNLDKLNTIKFLFYYKSSVHKYLYDSEKCIELKDGTENLSYYFYLILLINDNKGLFNYIYSFRYIQIINDKNKNNNDIYNKVIMSKIILELINNYLQFEEDNNDIINLKDENNNIIDNNIHIFNELNLYWNNEYKKLNVENIYLDIIKSLIKNNKFEDYNYTYNILRQLEIESIEISKIFSNKIYNIFIEYENIIKKYYISQEDDLYDNKKINFYFILLKYILKDSFFIYQITFLLKTRIFIIKLLNSNSNIFSNTNNTDNELEEKLKFIIKIITDSKYYMKKYYKLNNINNDSIIKNKIYDKATEENSENDKKDKTILSKINNNIHEFYNSKDGNENTYIKESNSNTQDNFDNKNIDEKNFDSKNIDEKSKNEKKQTKNSESQSSSNISYISSNSKTKSEYDSKNEEVTKTKNSLLSDDNINTNSNKNRINPYKKNRYIFVFDKIIGNHKVKNEKEDNGKNQNKKFFEKYTADLIIEINNFYISVGTNNEILIFDQNQNCKEIKRITYEKNYINNICENDETELSVCLNEKLETIDLTKFIQKNHDFKTNLQEDKYYLNLIKLSKNFHIVCTQKYGIYCLDLFSGLIDLKQNVINLQYIKGGINLNDNYIALKIVKKNNSKKN